MPTTKRVHYAKGKPCDCDMIFGYDPTEYVKLHPNYTTDDGTSFNDQVETSKRSINRNGFE